MVEPSQGMEEEMKQEPMCGRASTTSAPHSEVGNGAGVGRQTVGLDGVNVGDAGELVEHGHEEHGHAAGGDTQHIREAGHKLTHGHLIE